MLSVSIAAEKLFDFFGFPVTNAVLTTVVISVLVIIFGIVVRSSLKRVPGRFQALVETLVEGAYKFVEDIAPNHAREIFPLVMTFLLYITFTNWFGLLPGLTGIGLVSAETHEQTSEITPSGETNVVLPETIHTDEYIVEENDQVVEHNLPEEEESKEEFIHIFRPGTSDLNMTIALALISVIAIQFFGMKHKGIRGYLRKFFTLKSPVDFFVGLLELVSEFGKIISFAFRLFGNVFAGEVLLAVIGMLVPIVIPIPFILLELFVGFIQAVVFFMLTLVFMQMTIQHD